LYDLKTIRHFALHASLLVGASSAWGASVTTPSLGVKSGAITFSDFSCDLVGSEIATPNCSSIDVVPLKPDPAGFDTLMNLAVTGPGSEAVVLGFKVSDTNGLESLGLSVASNVSGLAIGSVTEFVYTSLGGPLVGVASTLCTAPIGCSSDATVHLTGVFKELYVIDGFTLSSYTDADRGIMTGVAQTFTEPSPEPMSLTFVAGFFVLSFFCRLIRSYRTNTGVSAAPKVV
jgi:hypothetical protein